MKKYIIYIGILAVGLLLGWFLFGGSSNNEVEHNHNDVVETNQMWTCSMHPQIMQPEAGNCPICGMDLIPAETSAEGLNANEFKLTQNAMALANIQTSFVGNSKTEDNIIKLSGKIVENEEANAVQVSYFSGRIEGLHVNFTGEEVRKGQLLATIYSPELYAAQQELITAVSLKESQPALYKAVRNKLKLWKLSENQINQIETSGKVKENFPVYATVSGTVSKKLVEQGDYIKQGQPLFKIANLNSVWANFDVYENQINLFKKGQEISISTNADVSKEFKAKVDFIDPVLNIKTRTVTLRVVLNNQNNIFKPGMFVQANIEGNLGNKQGVITIPSSAVLWTGERSVVYLKNNPDQPIFEMREVSLGVRMGESYEVLDGLLQGDEIVTNGTFTIDAAAQLRGKKSMMNKEGDLIVTGHEGHGQILDNNQSNKSSESPSHKRVTVANDFKQQLQMVFEAYIGTKEALVEDDMKSVQQNARLLLNNLDKVDMKLLSDPGSHQHWMIAEKQMRMSAAAIEVSDDIKAQRNHFKELSTAITSAVQMYGIGQVVYNQFCPMADDNKGAYWLSNDKNVLNPYFGSAMIACGSVKQIIEE